MKKTSSISIFALTLSSAIILSTFSTSFANASSTSSKSYTGYLMDSKCATKGFDDMTSKINIKLYPEKHLTSCLSMKNCMASGLGILIKEGSSYKYYKFDKTGSKMADDNIMMKTSKKSNIKIAITGAIKGNTITLASVKEAK